MILPNALFDARQDSLLLNLALHVFGHSHRVVVPKLGLCLNYLFFHLLALLADPVVFVLYILYELGAIRRILFGDCAEGPLLIAKTLMERLDGRLEVSALILDDLLGLLLACNIFFEIGVHFGRLPHQLVFEFELPVCVALVEDADAFGARRVRPLVMQLLSRREVRQMFSDSVLLAL